MPLRTTVPTRIVKISHQHSVRFAHAPAPPAPELCTGPARPLGDPPGTSPCEPRRGAGERAARARKGPPSALLYMVTDKKRNTPGLGRRQSSRDTLWFRRPPPRRSRVTDMNREEKVSPTYHHRRSTGAPILSAGASARSPVGSARAGSTAARVWVVDRRDSVWRRCSPGSREADVSRPAGRRNSDG